VADEPPLSTLLSQALVAFTVEFDNEFEHQIPHRTTRGLAGDQPRGPWLVSQAMWSNLLQFISEDGVPLRDVEGLARLTNLPGLERWGYLRIEPAAGDDRPKPPRADGVVRPTRVGRQAQAVWGPLGDVIEARWRARFGEAPTRRLRAALGAVAGRLEPELPSYLPVVSQAMFATIPDLRGPVAASATARVGPSLDVSVLLSRVLLAFTLEVERGSPVSLPMSANVLRVLDEDETPLRDVPRRSGVSKEAISMAVGFLARRGDVAVTPDPAGRRGRVARVTPSGAEAHRGLQVRLGAVEARWRDRLGPDDVRDLRESLGSLVGDPTAPDSPLLRGVEPYPDSWRAQRPRPDTLPHYPMVLHRGGFPDGS
jgi:DNA-binding MarR family transcriptional regulator